ncbi:MAG TPA: hypothetical protein VIC26_03755 [Marinagarivorans sp.]
MQIDLEIGLSLVVIVAIIAGMAYATRYVFKHIEHDEKRSQRGNR